MIERINVYYKGLASEELTDAPGAYAWMAFHDDELIHQNSKFLNNEPRLSRVTSEYKCIMEAMQWLIDADKHPHHIRFYGDEALVVNHLTRRWKPKRELFPLCRQVQFIQAGLKDVHFNWISVDKNISVALTLQTLSKNGVDGMVYLAAQERLTREKIASGEY